VVFDETAADAGLAIFILVRRSFGPAGQRLKARQRVSEVSSPTRFAAENAANGGRCSEGLSIAAPARTERRSATARLRRSGLSNRPRAAPPSDRVRPGRSSSVAVKRSSTRCVRRRLRPPSDRAEPRGRKAARGRSRTNQAAGCSCRRSVAEIGETHLSLLRPLGRAARRARARGIV